MSVQPFTEAAGRAAVLLQPNIDTDVIIRIDRLTESRIHPEGRRSLGRWALEPLRYAPDGSERPDCPLNDPALRGAPILIAGPNFGCGSSREGAVWALMGMGFRCVVAEGFGDIFHNNCFQNGMLPIVLPAGTVADLAVRARQGALLRVDLVGRVISVPGAPPVPFPIDASRRHALLEGLDELGQSLRHASAIRAWQDADQTARPWVWLGRR